MMQLLKFPGKVETLYLLKLILKFRIGKFAHEVFLVNRNFSQTSTKPQIGAASTIVICMAEICTSSYCLVELISKAFNKLFNNGHPAS